MRKIGTDEAGNEKVHHSSGFLSEKSCSVFLRDPLHLLVKFLRSISVHDFTIAWCSSSGRLDDQI
jgi:hypothetical protein